MATSRKLWLLIVLLLAGAAAAIYIALGDLPWKAASPANPNDGSGANGKPSGDHPHLATAPATASAPASQATAAKEAFDRGMEFLREDKLIKARTELSAAYFSGGLSADLEDQARKRLEELADRTVFSRLAIEGDAYADIYRVKAKDSLQKIEQSQKLHVPADLLARTNGIADPSRLQEGMTIKLIRGPFHAVVYKHRFVMDVYLQRDDLPKVFIRRFQVGLGRNGSTPLGSWHVRLGRPARPATDSAPAQGAISGKLRQARFDPPPNCEIDHSIMPGEPDYPFGPKGLFIPLEGDDDNTRQMLNYGIHSTSDPTSIGKEGSLGCVRLRDDDIELVFSLLYEKWSTVRTSP
jgi:hypothetical protein